MKQGAKELNTLEQEVYDIQGAIINSFLYHPNSVMNAEDAFSQVKRDLDKGGLKRENTKIGLVVCRDDINFIQNGAKQIEAGSYEDKNFIDLFVEEYGAGMPLGGLGGFLTAGPEGINANVHHAPQDKDGNFSNYLLLFGAHVGYTPEHGFGYNLRNFQNEPVSNCGAIVGLTHKILGKEKVDTSKMGLEAAFAYDFLNKNSDDIIHSQDPIVRATELTHQQIKGQVYDALCMAKPKIKNIYLVEALTFNTDNHLPDQIALGNYGLINL